jgi:hypothetical protein
MVVIDKRQEIPVRRKENPDREEKYLLVANYGVRGAADKSVACSINGYKGQLPNACPDKHFNCKYLFVLKV